MPSNVLLLVLGDPGRSPRMLYHSLSLLNLSHNVTILGYVGTPLIDGLLGVNDVRVEPVYLGWCRFKPFYYGVRLVSLLYQFGKEIMKLEGDVVIVQNPPSFPTLFLGVLCKMRGWEVLIDWHNLGYTMFPEERGWLRWGVRGLEREVGRRFGGFCVSEGMKRFLREEMDVNVEVLHDRPPSHFKPTGLIEKHELFKRLNLSSKFSTNLTSDQTLFTETINGVIKERKGRPRLIMSSTSWTPDEDFSILLKALEEIDGEIGREVLCIVTGKGPEKEYYVNKIKEMDLKEIDIMTVWLEASDYPILVGSADLGVCLHTSTSGIDLPMKVVDMFGGGVPVAAVGFECLDELVVDGKNGRVFKDWNELKGILKELLGKEGEGELERLRKGVGQGLRWEENWDNIALPVINECLEKCKEKKAREEDSISWKEKALMLALGVAITIYQNSYMWGALGFMFWYALEEFLERSRAARAMLLLLMLLVASAGCWMFWSLERASYELRK
ncbi:hypothetical protein TrST_g9596 [Triparma strigata]|uniref:Beta-1,4-mannosyltransferase n=1 Tax=Triparma strigata TaxID=1606541 RepID=A0A9W6ZWL1_9STRA|nr:hypothetical protein TrST_g9596 [Triparma strigata]